MPFPHNVYKTQRIVPLRFSRGVTGPPNIHHPDIDNRGWFRPGPAGNVPATNDHGFVMGVTQGDTVFVKATREKLEASANLFVTSSDTSVMTATQVGGADALTNSTEMIVQITGVSGGAGAAPKVARAQIRFGTNSGPIIGEISIWVFAKLNVNITPHNVTIQDAGGGSVPSAANIVGIMDMVKAFWRPCGVDFTVAAVQNDTVTFANAGDAAWQAEINTILSTNWVPGSINAYFVNRIVIPGPDSAGTLGLGISRPNSVVFGTPNPGIILGDTNVSGSARATDTHWLANDIAHEVGHFFTLPHVDNNDDPGRNDTWALRFLMHPFNTRTMPGFRNDTGYGVDGSGDGYRGGLVSMKNLTDSGNAANHATDGECSTSRTTITSVAGPY